MICSEGEISHGGFLQADLFPTKFFARKMICSWPCPSSWNAFASNTTRSRTPTRRSTRSPPMAKRSPVTKRIGKFPIPPLKPELFIQCSFHIESVTWTYLEHPTIGDVWTYFRSTQQLGTAHLVDQVVSFPTDFFLLLFCYLFPYNHRFSGKWAPYMKRKRIIGDTLPFFHDQPWLWVKGYPPKIWTGNLYTQNLTFALFLSNGLRYDQRSLDFQQPMETTWRFFLTLKILGYNPYLEDHPNLIKWLISIVNKSPKWGCSPSKMA